MPKNPYARFEKSDREKLIKEFIPVIKHLALKVSKGHEDGALIEDLISAGIVGLLEALERYEPERGVKLKTYAYLRIKGAMIDELRSKDFFSRVARSRNRQIEEAVRILEVKLKRPPEESEVAEFLQIDLEDYRKMLNEYKDLHVISIDEISEIFSEDRETILRYIMNENSEDYPFELKELERILAKEIERLPEKQRLVLTLYYYEDLNMKEIAKVLNITEARVSQIHTQAIFNLRISLEKYLKDSRM